MQASAVARPHSVLLIEDFLAVVQSLAAVESGEVKPITLLAQEVLSHQAHAENYLPRWVERLVEHLSPENILEHGAYLTAYCQFVSVHPVTAFHPHSLIAAETLQLFQCAGASRDVRGKAIPALLVNYMFNVLLARVWLPFTRKLLVQALFQQGNAVTLSQKGIETVWQFANEHSEPFLKVVCIQEARLLFPKDNLIAATACNLPDSLKAFLFSSHPLSITISRGGQIHISCAQLGPEEAQLCSQLGFDKVKVGRQEIALPLHQPTPADAAKAAASPLESMQPSPTSALGLPDNPAIRQALERIVTEGESYSFKKSLCSDVGTFLAIYCYSLNTRHARLNLFCRQILGDQRRCLIETTLASYKRQELFASLTEWWKLAKSNNDGPLQFFCILLLRAFLTKISSFPLQIKGKPPENIPSDLYLFSEKLWDTYRVEWLHLGIDDALSTVHCHTKIGVQFDGPNYSTDKISNTVALSKQLSIEQVDIVASYKQELFNAQIIEALNTMPPLQGLSLTLDDLNSFLMAHLPRVLRRHPLSVLKLVFSHSDQDSYQLLAKLVETLPLRSFTFFNSSLSLPIAHDLLEAVVKLTSLHKLDISQCLNGKDSIVAIVPALKRMTSLKELHLRGCRLASSSNAVLGEILPCLSQIRTLNLSENALDDSSIEAFLPTLQRLVHLDTLDLEKNRIGDRAVLILMDNLAKHETPLHILLKHNLVSKSTQRQMKENRGNVIFHFKNSCDDYARDGT